MGGVRWKLFRKISKDTTESYVVATLCEVDMKLTALLEQLGERIEKEQLDRMIAERAIARELAGREQINNDRNRSNQ